MNANLQLLYDKLQFLIGNPVAWWDLLESGRLTFGLLANVKLFGPDLILSINQVTFRLDDGQWQKTQATFHFSTDRGLDDSDLLPDKVRVISGGQALYVSTATSPEAA